MPDIEAVEVLQQAKERLFEHGWGIGTAWYRNWQDGDKESMCLEECLLNRRGGFLLTDTRSLPVKRAASYIASVVASGYSELWMWNDQQTTASAVFDAIDQAISLAKESPAP